ncbi:DNA polymerase III, beta subunit [Ligilactobacillus sp. WC1T17]|uniref:Beta sliding clamp n=1 Tax=Ligilactobacillus ruminis TaxID=1623 RepID=A0ABY1A948_9LACO|nr:DNA polymerase III, beta subunit [Ligilactobacillus ruminis]
MKFSVQRTAFLQYLNTALSAISGKTTLEILSGLKLNLSEDALTLTGSNSDISIETILSIADEHAALNIEEPGSIVLPARFFSEIVKKLPADQMQVTVNDRLQTTIISGPAEFSINGIDAQAYPHLPEIDSREQIKLPSDLLKQVIDQTVIATSKQETRPMLTGVHLTIAANELKAVATDSHRLSQRKANLESTITGKYDILVPGESLNKLSRMLSDVNEDVELQISENQVLFLLDHTSFYSRLLEGQYPNTDQLIPTSHDTMLEIDAPQLLHSIERASLLSHEGHNNVIKLTLDADNQKAILFGNTPEVGNVEEELQFAKLEGSGIEIFFNPDYMKDALKSFGQSDVKLNFTMPLRPFTIVPAEDDGSFVQLITPVRTA